MQTIEIKASDSYKPIDKQDEAHRCPARYIFYGGAMGGGKSVWLCRSGMSLSVEYEGNVGLLCRWELSSFKRTTQVTWDKFVPDFLIKKHWRADQLYEFYNGSLVYYIGLKPSSSFSALERLKSLDLGWFGVDESTEIEKIYFDLLKTRLRHELPGGGFPRFKGLLTGNPEPGWTADTFVEQGLPNHAFIQALPRENPHLPPGYVEQQKEDLPPELYEQYIEGSYDVLMTMGQYVFPYSSIKAAQERELEPKGRREAGVDIARFGGDENVAAIRQGPVVDIAYNSSHQDTNKTTDDLAKFIDEEEPETTKVDSVGVGAGVYDNLKAMGYNVREVVGGASPRDKDRFLNARAENHWGLRKRMTDGDLDLPEGQKIRSQLAGIKYKTVTDRKLKIESKEEMKRRGVKSPDYAEAIINAFAEGTEQQSSVWFV
jgi:hypothetical protein